MYILGTCALVMILWRQWNPVVGLNYSYAQRPGTSPEAVRWIRTSGIVHHLKYSVRTDLLPDAPLILC